MTPQTSIDAYFEADATYWRDIYAQPGTQAEIFRERLGCVVDWVDALECAPGGRALDLGCGAGFLAVMLARRGFHVDAVDHSQEMVDLTRHTVETAGLPGINVARGDARALAFPDASFDLLIAIAVLPWVPRAEPVIEEIARVLKPGGYVILTIDNRARLSALLDPKYNPALRPVREGIKTLLVRLHRRQPSRYPDATFHRRRFIDRRLAQAGLLKLRSRTVGFGPFSLFGHPLVPEPLGIRLHHGLQALADRRVPWLQATGGHYLVLAQKRPADPLR